MTFEKLTSSFTIDDRDENGRRKGVFYSASVTRNNSESKGWTASEAMVTACMLAKHVVAMTFRDALHRGVVSKQTVSQELPGILTAYDQSIAKIVAGEGK